MQAQASKGESLQGKHDKGMCGLMPLPVKQREHAGAGGGWAQKRGGGRGVLQCVQPCSPQPFTVASHCEEPTTDTPQRPTSPHLRPPRRPRRTCWPVWRASAAATREIFSDQRWLRAHWTSLTDWGMASPHTWMVLTPPQKLHPSHAVLDHMLADTCTCFFNPCQVAPLLLLLLLYCAYRRAHMGPQLWEGAGTEACMQHTVAWQNSHTSCPVAKLQCHRLPLN